MQDQLEKLDSIKVSELMSSTVLTVFTDDSLAAVTDKLAENGIGAIPILDRNSGELKGIFSERDLLKIATKSENFTKPISNFMSTQIISLGPDDLVEKCYELMMKNNIRHIPILSGKELVGMLSIKDLIIARDEIVGEKLSEQSNQIQKLMGAICHDLRAPISIAISYNELLRTGDIDHEEYMDRLPGVENGLRSALELISDMLDMSKLGPGSIKISKSDVHIPSLLDELVSQASVLAKTKNITINCDCDSGVGVVALDNRKARQVINNLLTNAIKFSKEESTITVRLEDLHEKFCISVQDEGVGMSQEKIAEIFANYKSTSTVGTVGEKGYGLGLGIVKKIIEYHGGTFSIESEIGKGTKAKICLPF